MSDLNKIIMRLEAAGFYAGPNRKYGGITVGACHEGISYNEATKALGELPEATFLGALNEDIADDGFERICRLTNLRELSIKYAYKTPLNLVPLPRLLKLEILRLDHVAKLDQGMVHIAQLKTLRELCLYNSELTDAGLAHLQEMPALQRLNLDGTKVQKAFEGLRGSPQLTDLSVDESPVTDEGVAVIGRVGSLERLILSRTQVTDRGLPSLGGLDKLFCLTLTETKVTDAGLAHLADCANLHDLWFDVPLLTPRGIKHLTKLPNLTDISVFGDKYDPDLAARVEAALPQCDIDWFMPHAPQSLGN